MRQFTNTADFMRQQEIIDSINRYDFKNVYELADAQTYGSNICEISKIFEIAGFDPLKYMDEIPKLYKFSDQDVEYVDLTNYNNIFRISPYAYSHCSNLKSVIIGKNVSRISSEAFANCQNLHDLHILSTDIKINARAFAYDMNLSNVSIADAVLEIGEDAFYCCKNLKYIEYAGTMNDLNRYCTISSTAFNHQFQGIKCKDGFIDWQK